MKKYIVFALVLLVALIAGCAAVAPVPTPAPTATVAPTVRPNHELVWAWGWTAKFGSMENPIGKTSWGVSDGLEKPIAACSGALWFNDETKRPIGITPVPAKEYPIIKGTCKVTSVIRVTFEEAEKIFVMRDSYTENLQ